MPIRIAGTFAKDTTMTTKAEFDAFIAGFKLAGHEHLDMAQLDTILAKVDEVIAALAPVPVTVAAEPDQEPVAPAPSAEPATAAAPVEQVTESLPDPAPVAEAPPVADTADTAQVTETPVDTAAVEEVVAGDAQQAVTDVQGSPV